MALTAISFVMALPLWGRMEWFARAFMQGHGERTSPSPGGLHFEKSISGWPSGTAGVAMLDTDRDDRQKIGT